MTAFVLGREYGLLRNKDVIGKRKDESEAITWVEREMQNAKKVKAT